MTDTLSPPQGLHPIGTCGTLAGFKAPRSHYSVLLCCVILCALAVIFAAQPALAATATAQPAPGKPLRILCSVFPVYQFTQNITAGRADAQVSLMLPPALGCPHDYLLTPQDMTKIASADVFVINGLGLEEFLGAPLKRANPKLTVIDASTGIKDIIPNHEDEASHDEHPGTPQTGGHAHGGPNPHIFADPALAARMVVNIAEGLAKIDPPGAPLYRKNAAAYSARLNQLAKDFATAVRSFRSCKIVTTHNVFDYLARDAKLQVVAVIEEAPGQDPSAARMLALARTIKASGAAAVFTEPQYPAGVARAVAREAGVPVAALDPVASGPAAAPPDYYEKTMRQNLETLGKILK